jgi:AcrR family transcriptional regulator
MNDIADEAQVSRDKSQNLYRNKEAIISDVMKRANNAALADSLEFQENDSIKDKLFSLMMARFDYLAPYRKGIARIIKSSNRSPLQALARLPQVMKTMNLMLQTAGVRTNSPSGIIKINGLTLISANAMWVWLHDETVDLTPTMVALDKGLSRADTLIGKVFLCSAQ